MAELENDSFAILKGGLWHGQRMPDIIPAETESLNVPVKPHGFENYKFTGQFETLFGERSAVFEYGIR